MEAKGAFDVQVKLDPAYHEDEAVTLGRASIDKRFRGAMEGTSSLQMLGARSKTKGSAGYAALEHFNGSVDGLRGSFALVHLGLMHGSDSSLTVTIVPNSGTAQLARIAGTMSIRIEAGRHDYTLSYRLDGDAAGE